MWLNTSVAENSLNPFTTSMSGQDNSVRFEKEGNVAYWVVGGQQGRTYLPDYELTTLFAPNEWHHVALVSDNAGSAITGYFDGVERFSTQTNPHFPTHFSDAVIGAGYLNTPERYWVGLVDEVAIYNRALTNGEIKAIYDAGNAGKIKPGDEVTVYSNDFEGTVGPEWSNTSLDTTPAGARRFLGQFGNGLVTLALGDLPSHTQATVSFDLFIIGSWDGNGIPFGPDVWDLSVAGGPTLVHTTFANNPALPQSYPSTHPGDDHSPRTGALEDNTLGYSFGIEPTDAVYRLSFTFAHSGSSLVLDFSGSGLEDLDNESWGLDNVVVRVR